MDVKAVKFIVKAATNPSFANDNNSKVDKSRSYTNISAIPAAPLIKQLRQ